MISIVVPAYNIADYLERCIESVLAQKYTDWELLLIDDGSTDATPGICDAFAARDSRIRVFHLQNGGVSRARNHGIENARGEWLTFVDGDDYLTDTYLKDMIDAAGQSGVDMVISGWVKDDVEHHLTPEYVGPDEKMYFFTKGEHFGYILGKLYRMDVVRKGHLMFDEGVRWSEDSMFFNRALTQIHDAQVISASNYIYYTREGSSITRIYSWDDEIRGFAAVHVLMPQLVESLGAGISKYYGPYENLWRAIKSLYINNVPRAQRMALLRGVQFNKSYMHNRPHGYKERIFTYLVTNRKWWLLDRLLARHYGV